MTVQGHGWDDTVGYPAFRNVIINGGMEVSQRNGTSTITPTDGQFVLDRWKAGLTQASKFTVAQSTTAPAGFINSQLITSSSAYSIGVNDEFEIIQGIEGSYIQRLAWGTANAKTVTLSFYVRSSLTGTFGGCIYDSVTNYSYVFSYSISAANTWERKTITIAGPTSGTWGTGNSLGAQIIFNFGAGSNRTTTAGTWFSGFKVGPTGTTNLTGVSGATFYITGIQLEVGSVATPFEFEPFETTLRKCQRYFQKSTPYSQTNFTTLASDSGMASGKCWITTGAGGGGIRIVFPVEMRTNPTLDITSWTTTSTNVADGATVVTHSPGIGDTTSIMETKSAAGLSLYSTATEYKMFFFWRCNAEL